jgi:transposase
MLAELVDHVIGVDPDRDWITIAVVDAHTTGVVAEAKFPTTSDGYREAVDMADATAVRPNGPGASRAPPAMAAVSLRC